MKRIGIVISGIVQGVGFRPFVYNLAKKYNLAGWVLNDADGIRIEAEGTPSNLAAFKTDLECNAPPLAVIMSITISALPLQDETFFEIRDSIAQSARSALITPDVGICPDCSAELVDTHNRRFAYPFINCTNCGPRYSIVVDVPYDRAKTTMSKFCMCEACQAEYYDPGNRRFHAQPNACSECGPTCILLNKDGRIIEGEPLSTARRLVMSGAILAVKGIGGYHLACNAFDKDAVKTLRTRKVREDKPFAVMAGDITALRQHCLTTSVEEELLLGPVRPIVLLKKTPDYNLAEAVAPHNPYLGVMLPYAPIHLLLLNPDDIWVMTSGNISDEPIAYLDEDALQRLSNIADCFLVHDRPVYRRTDDSVVRTFHDKPYILRRGRGLAPNPVRLATSGPRVLACGGELKNTFCLTKSNMAFVSSHIGDLENMPTFEAYQAAIEHYKRLFAIQPEVVAYDLHPEYLATKYGKKLDLPQIAVQHHHAHIASVMAEHGVTEPVIGVAYDGTGYGTDGKIWGGEFLLADCKDFKRLAHCRYLPLPGGSKAIKEPWRLAAWVLRQLYGEEFVNLNIPLTRCLPSGWQLALQAADKGINSPLSSSAGRLFDIAAAILGIRNFVNYEGQAAIELELAATGAKGIAFPYSIEPAASDIYQLDFRPTFAAMVEAIGQEVNQAEVAASFHVTMATATIDMIDRLSKITGVKKVVLSGGVFQNMVFLHQVYAGLEKKFDVFLPRQVPPNDGGLALGQAIIALERSR